MSRKAKAFAKINLFLDITGKRPDGYHELDSIFQSVSLCDEIKITTSTNTNPLIFLIFSFVFKTKCKYTLFFLYTYKKL